MENLTLDLLQSLPLLLLLVMALFLMIAEAIDRQSIVVPYIGIASLLVSALLEFPFDDKTGDIYRSVTIYNGMLKVRGIASLFHVVLCIAGAFTLAFAVPYFQKLKQYKESITGEITILTLFAVIGMILLANANDLIITFIGLETMSVCLYIMAGAIKTRKENNEAGIKYFLLGAFASAFLLYGIALIYGASGSTNYNKMNMALLHYSPLFYAGMGLILVGFLFKVSAFPFHFWTPDVYQGAPTPLVGFMSTASKSAAFWGLMLFIVAITAVPKINLLLQAVSVLTMIWGNFMAIRQTNLKRLLAYSSIAHAGYVLLAFSAYSNMGFQAVVFYMITYTLMNITAFGVISLIEGEKLSTNNKDLQGLYYQKPVYAILLSVCMLALSGIPPFVGFMAKYQVFAAAIKAKLFVPSVIGIITSVAAAFYYLSVIRRICFVRPDEKNTHTPFEPDGLTYAALGVLVTGIVIFGIYPSPILNLVNKLYLYSVQFVG
ncbi:MAG: NADH-quinone oxidoreductase subunit N [Bacteroidia bacterium]|nr:NADH-quinone oxidoreductase subunit N [Bacteroidia bacterium]MDW8302970.1 NADH-quinone oxidoreductase subunit N [Bacteroidia bacterium]